MEDHRDDLAVIAAGYPDEMADADRRQPGPAEPLRPHDPLPRLHDRGAGGHLRVDERRPTATTSTRAAAPALAEVIDAEPRTRGLRQRPLRAQRVRGRGQPPGRAPGRPSRRPTDEQLTTLTAADVVAPDRTEPASPPSACSRRPCGSGLGGGGCGGARATRAARCCSRSWSSAAGLLGHVGDEDRHQQVDEVAGEQPVALVRALAGPPAELDVGEAHRRVAPVQRRADDARRQQRADQRAPAGDAVAGVAAARVVEDRRLARARSRRLLRLTSSAAMRRYARPPSGSCSLATSGRMNADASTRMSGVRLASYWSSRALRRASISRPCLAMIARSRPSRSPKWYCSDVVLRCWASRLISRSDTPSMPRAANSRSAAAIRTPTPRASRAPRIAGSAARSPVSPSGRPYRCLRRTPTEPAPERPPEAR